jgi:hypothetical protein
MLSFNEWLNESTAQSIAVDYTYGKLKAIVDGQVRVYNLDGGLLNFWNSKGILNNPRKLYRNLAKVPNFEVVTNG